MGKSYTLAWRKSMSIEDQRGFDAWLKRNAVAGAVFAAGLVAMSVFGSHQAMPPDGTVAEGARPALSVATVTPK